MPRNEIRLLLFEVNEIDRRLSAAERNGTWRAELDGLDIRTEVLAVRAREARNELETVASWRESEFRKAEEAINALAGRLSELRFIEARMDQSHRIEAVRRELRGRDSELRIARWCDWLPREVREPLLSDLLELTDRARKRGDSESRISRVANWQIFSAFASLVPPFVWQFLMAKFCGVFAFVIWRAAGVAPPKLDGSKPSVLDHREP